MRILLVDEVHETAVLLVRLLTRSGHEVRVAVDTEEAVLLANDWLPDVAVLDLCLPGLDGYEVARRLRALENPVRMSIIALSGIPDPDRGREAGIDHALLKPVSLSRLLVAIDRLRNKTRTRNPA